MAENDIDADTAGRELLTLRDLYMSIQDQLGLNIERSLNLGDKSLAGRFDDVLLRQKFWEEDIRMEDGALSDLEANDASASSIIRLYLDEIFFLLHDIYSTMDIFHIRACLAAMMVHLTMISETNGQKEKISLLYETNARLCDQVEIFDAISANKTADTAGSDRKSSTIDQLRHYLEEENEMLKSRREKRAQAPSVLSPRKESEAPSAKFNSKRSNDKREIDPTPSSAELGPKDFKEMLSDSPTTEDKAFGRPDLTRFFAPTPYSLTAQRIREARKRVALPLKESEMIVRVLSKHASVVSYYNILVGPESENDPRIRAALWIEFVRAQQWGDFASREERTLERALGFWSLCESILISEAELLSRLAPLMKRAVPVHGVSGQIGLDPEVPREWLEDSVHQLSYWNDTLIDLIPRLKQESLRRRLRISFSTNGTVELQHLVSASALLGYSDLEHIAKARIRIEHAISNVQLHDHHQEELKKISLPSGNPLWLDEAELETMSHSPTLAGAIYKDERVMIHRFLRRDNYGGSRTDAKALYLNNLTRKLSCLSEVLNASVVTRGFLSLHNVGWFESGSDSLGCVYRLPPDLISSASPITLRQILRRAETEKEVLQLDKRFELSVALVKTLFELHTMGLFHGDIEPSNILFCPTAATGKDLDLGRPYLIGFSVESLQAVKRDLWPSSEAEREVYQPNRSWYLEKCDNSRSDFFALGLVLSAIGDWGCLSELGRRVSAFDNLDPSRDDKYGVYEYKVYEEEGVGDRLKDFVGQKYGDAVKVCLSFNPKYRSSAVSEADDGEKEWRAHLNMIETHVVEPITMCNA
ncbi:MAG: hypothetical protein Q9161_008704 [Pseudevernia consocians]